MSEQDYRPRPPLERVWYLDITGVSGWVDNPFKCAPELCWQEGRVLGVRNFHGLDCLIMAGGGGANDEGSGDITTIPVGCITSRKVLSHD